LDPWGVVLNRASSFSAWFLKHFAYNHSLLPLPL
jgi:hypothetical protein